jgi:hypothetical protein
MKNRIYRWTDRRIVGLADRMGVTLAIAKPLDLRGCDIHPLEAYCCNQAELMNVGWISEAHPPIRAGGCGASALSTLPITSFKVG